MSLRNSLRASLILAIAVQPWPSWAKTAQFTLSQTEPGTYRVEGKFTVKATSETVWSVLTDYNHIHQFVSTMLFSQVKERFPDHLLLDQVASGRFLLFSRKIHVLLQVREEPLKRIEFTDVSRKDFELYAGSWDIEKAPDGLSVRYSLKAKPSFSAPSYVEKKVVRRNTQNLLEQVWSEIERRSETAVAR